MPIIKFRQQPLHPEGEFAGQARKVSQGWSKPKPRPDGTTPEPHMIFTVPLHTHIGRTITHILRVLESTEWQWQAACRSGEMIPESGEIRVTTDDLENRVFYFGVVHEEYNGVPQAKVKMHTKSYAIQVNPELATVRFPNEAARPIYLRAVTPTGPDSGTQPSQEPGATAPPTSNIAAPPTSNVTPSTPAPAPAPTPPSSPIPPVGEPKEPPAINPAPPEGISEEEFREALLYARRLADEKKNPKGKAA